MNNHIIIEFNNINQNFSKTNQINSIKEEHHEFLQKMVQARVHLGHKAKKWNPKMANFIYQTTQGIHIIDIVQSFIYLRKICKLLYTTASNKDFKTFLFVGTQEQSPIPHCIKKNALGCRSFYVHQKWLSGTLTNWRNTKKSLSILKYLKLYRKTKRFEQISMKLQSILEKKITKLERYFIGIQNMKSLPDIVIIVGQQSQINTIKECQKLNIKTITIVDTDCNPELGDFFLPANDDSSSSLDFILGEFQRAITLGRQVQCKNNNSVNEIKSILQII